MSTDNTIDIVKLALDSCVMRQTAFANNMANINTEGYQPISVNFEKQLEQVSELNEQNLSMIKPYYQTEDTSLSPDSILAQSIKKYDAISSADKRHEPKVIDYENSITWEQLIMSYDQIFNIAAAGMDIEKLRFDVAANNIANQHSLRNVDGSPFKPSQVTATAIPFDSILSEQVKEGVAQVEITPQNLPPNKMYQPGHPDADKQGYVSYPGISTVDEMTTLLRATRAYEADIKIMNMARSMYLQALSIGEER